MCTCMGTHDCAICFSKYIFFSLQTVTVVAPTLIMDFFNKPAFLSFWMEFIGSFVVKRGYKQKAVNRSAKDPISLKCVVQYVTNGGPKSTQLLAHCITTAISISFIEKSKTILQTRSMYCTRSNNDRS